MLRKYDKGNVPCGCPRNFSTHYRGKNWFSIQNIVGDHRYVTLDKIEQNKYGKRVQNP